MNVLKIYKSLASYPLGKHIFSALFSLKAPYFMTIFPVVRELKEGKAVVTIGHRWIVQNHIKTVHAIAVCNAVEMCMGCVAESTIPAHLRWLPKGMDISYLRKATGTLTATSDISPELFMLKSYPGDIIVPVSVTNAEGQEVSKAEVDYITHHIKYMIIVNFFDLSYSQVRLYISEKKKASS